MPGCNREAAARPELAAPAPISPKAALPAGSPPANMLAEAVPASVSPSGCGDTAGAALAWAAAPARRSGCGEMIMAVAPSSAGLASTPSASRRAASSHDAGFAGAPGDGGGAAAAPAAAAAEAEGLKTITCTADSKRNWSLQ